jgi:hypothetical protein
MNRNGTGWRLKHCPAHPFLLATVILVLSVVPARAQHHTQPTEVISENDVQLHWLLSASNHPVHTKGLPDLDRFTAMAVIANFRLQYEQMVQTYNEQAMELERHGKRGDTELITRQINQLVSSTMQELQNRLTLLSYKLVLDKTAHFRQHSMEGGVK